MSPSYVLSSDTTARLDAMVHDIETGPLATVPPGEMDPPDVPLNIREVVNDLPEGLTEEDMEAFIGQPMRFEFKSNRMDFTAEDFLLSFSQPNFYFHCATAYNILRMKGLPVGKMDFMGRMRIKR